MLNCDWAGALARYDCRQVRDLHGGDALEIGTPFSLPGGAAIVLYVVQQGAHVLITDNGDTVTHLSALGLDVWHGARLKQIRERAQPYGMTLDQAGDLRCLGTAEQAPFLFAKAISGVLAVGDWSAAQLRVEITSRDLAAEAEPYIIARAPDARFERNKSVRGASSTEYKFDILHGADLVDVIAPSAQASGSSMRKAGDVQNGPFSDGMSPLFIVDDREDPARASQEISIIASIARAMPFSRLIASTTH